MKPTKEEILKSKFKSSFLDLDYLELYLEAMQEYANLYHKEKLRGEMKAFHIWYVSPPAITLILQSNTDEDTILCEYLNTLNTK